VSVRVRLGLAVAVRLGKGRGVAVRVRVAVAGGVAVAVVVAVGAAVAVLAVRGGSVGSAAFAIPSSAEDGAPGVTAGLARAESAIITRTRTATLFKFMLPEYNIDLPPSATRQVSQKESFAQCRPLPFVGSRTIWGISTHVG
jgi:hypothetical protein